MPARLIFVSCGQLTEEERNLGQRIKAEIDATEGYHGYFADCVQDLSGLANHILDALRRCAGAVVVLHPRGRVLSEQGQDFGVRSSVWINQELAILAYRQFFEGSNIPILAFKDDLVALEGAMTAFIVNPKPLVDQESVLRELRNWLRNEATKAAPSQQDVFEEKWAVLDPDDREVLAALVAEGGRDVKETSVRRRLVRQHGLDKNRASEVLRKRRLVLSELNLVQLRHNIYDGDEVSLHPTWEWYVRHAVRQSRTRSASA